MSSLEYGLWSIPLLLVLIFLRIPIGLAMFGVGLVGTSLVTGTTVPALAQLKSLVYSTFSNYSLSIVPLFLLMGQFATRGGMSRALFRAAETLVGHRRGGVAMAAVAACGGFGAICGSSLATAATMGQVALPEMRRCGYSGALSTACLAAGGTLGILIPPSVVLVIYAILTEQNIAKLFMAAFVPGLLAAAGYMLTVSLYVRFRPDSAGSQPRASGKERLQALIAVWPVLTIFIVVIGGIYAGLFTPTEGAAVGAAGTGLVAWANRDLGWNGLKQAILSTAASTGMIFFIVLGATVFNSFLAFSQLPQQAAGFVVELGLNPWAVLVLILICYLVFGCIMDSLSMILLTIPIFFPIVSALDFGLPPEEFALWFGILVLIVVEVGLITPPVGMNLFVINSMAPDVPLGRTYRGVVPFIASDIIRVAILVLFPGLTLFLVRLLY
ncbi:TRAP transporter large permease [Stappia taiwanensis]|uniref:TRAP transporter large permease protein n=1 Tax=Stappia taiwanensis TaxID=992267 RepID=A0A838XTI9_9HYPH|nr:TRAP transporter large permease [Stappia taiwanensis]MBA4611856.1 TRAP transporter large permease [Stappia taiwanensis]GGF03318.1 C4-dicarboxylate ABC transporter permease [Stappia taiwanensis]